MLRKNTDLPLDLLCLFDDQFVAQQRVGCVTCQRDQADNEGPSEPNTTKTKPLVEAVRTLLDFAQDFGILLGKTGGELTLG